MDIKPTKNDNDNSSSTDDENYIITTKLCRRLSKELQIPECVFDEIFPLYAPPKAWTRK